MFVVLGNVVNMHVCGVELYSTSKYAEPYIPDIQLPTELRLNILGLCFS